MSRSRNSLWNAGSSLLFTAITMLVGFVTTPLLLQWLGGERFGAWRWLMDWGGYMPLLEGGLSGALWARLAQALGRRDDEQVTQILTAGWRAYWRVALRFLLAGLVFALVFGWLVKTQTVALSEIRWAWLVAMTATLLLPFVVYRQLHEASQQTYFVVLVGTGQSLLTTGLSLYAAWRSWGLAAQAAALVAGQLPGVVILTWRGWQRYPLRWRGPADATTAAGLCALNRPAFAYMVSMRVGVLSDNVVIAALLGIAAVAPFFLTQRLLTLAQTQLLAFGNATWASLADLYANGETARFYERLLELTGLISGLSLALLVPLAVYSRSFVALWVGAENYGGAALIWLAGVNAWLGAVFYLWGWTLNSTGHIGKWERYALLFTAVNLAGSVVATFYLGLIGPLVGTLMGYLGVTAWALPLTLKRVFGWPPAVLWGKVWPPCIWALPYGALLYGFALWSGPRNWGRLSSELAGAFCLGLALWWGGLKPTARASLKARLQNAF